MPIKVSVIIPVYNMEKYIIPCIESILSQTLSDIEIICVDDGSNDGRISILERYQQQCENFFVIKQNRQGAGKARNKGIECARGEFVAFMDSDDYYPENDALETLYNDAITHNVMMAGGSLFRDVEGKRTAHWSADMVFSESCRMHAEEFQNFLGFYRFIYARELLIDNNIRFPDLKRFQDPPFMFDALVAAKEIWCSPKYVYAYREFDKKIEFSSYKIINDIACGLEDIMTKACKLGYTKTQEYLVHYIELQKNQFVAHICAGNTALYDALERIGKQIIDCQLRQTYEENWNLQGIQSEHKRLVDIENKYAESIRQHDHVIIYGAGQYGKNVYDFLEKIDKDKFVGFAVTDKKPSGTSRGMTIYCIDDLASYSKKNTLVIVAGKSEINHEMTQIVREKGFKNIISATEKVIGFSFFKMTQGVFSYDN